MAKMRLTIVFLVGFCCSSYAQSVESVVTNINKNYDSFQSFSCNVEYLLFDSTSSEPVEIQTGLVLKKGNSSFFKLGEIEVLTTENAIVQVDKGLRQVVYMPNQTKDNSLREASLGTIKKALEGCGDSRLGIEGDKSFVEMDSCRFSQYEGIKVFYHSSEFYVDKMIMVISKNERLEMNYSKVKINKGIASKDLSIERFLIGSGEKAELKKELVGYKFENYFKK